ncbi:putative type VI secretion system effector, partial [Burkholderia sp. 22313]|uniref:putative type VI secretion system effector n=1 Tax=Burkholderia sp. 22313 TaxID=3453908 RepID=UPI003F82BB2D
GEEVRAWIWLSVFENGDEVEVVAERSESGWIGYAIRRCGDGVLSIHPHCERGSRALFKNLLKWSMLFWSGCALIIALIQVVLMINDVEGWQTLLEGGILAWLTIEMVAIFIAYRIWRRFKSQLPMANRIFATFGWEDPPNVNLPKTSKKLRQPEDTWQMGKLIFRYIES